MARRCKMIVRHVDLDKEISICYTEMRSIYSKSPNFLAAMLMQRRHVEYWGSSVTGRTQPYAQGDMIPRVDNTHNVVNKPSADAASLTGNPLGIAYDNSNIFSVEEYSRVERDHYVPLRGLDCYKVDPIEECEGKAARVLMEAMEEDLEVDLNIAWWGPVLRDFPSLKTPCTAEFKTEFTEFYKAALDVAHDDASVKDLARPFVRQHMQKNFISFPMFWRIAERLGDALEKSPCADRYEKRASRVAVERVTKIALNTIADEPWAHRDATSPLFVDVSNFRAWHEAGNW